MERDGIDTSGPGSKPGPTRLPGRNRRRSRSTQRPDESAIASAARPARASCSPCAALCAAAATPMLSLRSLPLPLPSSFPSCSSHPSNIYLMRTSITPKSTPHAHLPPPVSFAGCCRLLSLSAVVSTPPGSLGHFLSTCLHRIGPEPSIWFVPRSHAALLPRTHMLTLQIYDMGTSGFPLLHCSIALCLPPSSWFLPLLLPPSTFPIP